MKKFIIIAVLLVHSILPFSFVWALMVMIPLAQKIHDADYIVVAQVNEIHSQREQFNPALNLIVSTLKIQVLENWKNQSAQNIIIKSFGGVLDGASYYSEDDPQLQVRDKIVLFLKNYDGILFPLYHAQGVYQVTGDNKIAGENVSVNDFKKQVQKFLKP